MDWLRQSAAAQARAMAAGQLDAVALTEAVLEAAEAHPGRDRIFARLTSERARAEAGAAQARHREGRALGPLDGVPVSWKDNVDTAGVATEGGTRLLAGRVPTEDAAALSHATSEGLVCIGKTHLSELAFSGLGVNPMTATPPNSGDPALAPGGSSSGAAVSVALGLASAAVGTDTGGSVRIPAAWNGLVGLKTTHGLVPAEGVVPLARSLDTVGPLTRTVEDAALMLDALTGTRNGVPEAAGTLSLHLSETVVLEGCDPEVEAAFDAAISRISSAGHALARGPVPEFAEAFDVTSRLSPIVTYEGWQEWGETIEAHPGTMFPMIEARFRLGAKVTAEADAEAKRLLAGLSAALTERMGETLILAPTAACLPPPVARLEADEAYYVERNLLALRNTRLGNILGLSALTLPTGHPMVGLMLIAGPGGERRLLAAGRALEPILRG